MEKLFHVFISSTYSDLIEERRRASEAVSKAGHVPEGMEIFPASSQRQFDFIKRVIQRCDYYVVILSGRYGSLAEGDVSYTEREYDYANSLGLPTLGFLRQDPTKIELGKVEQDSRKAERLREFRAKLESESLVDYWENPDQLATKIVAALAQEISSNPRVGWIRGDKAATESILSELNELRKQNQVLSGTLAASRAPVIVENLATLTDQFEIHYTFVPAPGLREQTSSIKLAWGEILKIAGSSFRVDGGINALASALSRYFHEVLGKKHYTIDFTTTDKQQILTQFELLGLMNAHVAGGRVFHVLTPTGLAETLRLNAVVQKSE